MAIFYKIVCPSNNSVNYLMGTFHLNHAAFEPLLQNAFELLSRSKHYYGEMDLTKVDPSIVGEIMRSQPTASPKIQKLLIKRQSSILRKFGHDVTSFSSLPIFSLLNELTVSLFKADLLPGSIDEELLKKAIEYKLTLGGLESFDEQLHIMKNLNKKDLEKQILEMLDKPKKFSKSMNKLFQWFLQGKTRKLHRTAKRNAKGNTNVLIDERNKIMAIRIMDIISTSDKNFFSFGAGHLSGNTGIVTLLKEKGMKVQKLSTIFLSAISKENPGI